MTVDGVEVYEAALPDEAQAYADMENEPTVVPDYVEVHASELRKVGNALKAAERYMKALNEMNAALHLEDPVYSPLTTNLSNAVARVEGMLEGFNAKLKERVDDDQSQD